MAVGSASSTYARCALALSSMVDAVKFQSEAIRRMKRPLGLCGEERGTGYGDGEEQDHLPLQQKGNSGFETTEKRRNIDKTLAGGGNGGAFEV